MNDKLNLLAQSVGYPLNEQMIQEFINKIPEIKQFPNYFAIKGEEPSKKDIQQQNCMKKQHFMILQMNRFPFVHNFALKFIITFNQVIQNCNEQKRIEINIQDDLICSFQILQESNTLHLTVLGKMIDQGDQFEILSIIDMILDGVLLTFDVKFYSKEQIKLCIFTLEYRMRHPILYLIIRIWILFANAH